MIAAASVPAAIQIEKCVREKQSFFCRRCTESTISPYKAHRENAQAITRIIRNETMLPTAESSLISPAPST